eukprot:Gregarina_sp_Poly_1__5309@NODE_2808_length_1689_cov_353_805179_g1769_i0_p3_GENE_NODE_2808_length_1689_cov_353_805179_g1769_i0NODE_2808_length_1689_cov_353_805179_g1769_i0_p3_ORF_typecomplete_len104_score14_67_NODE_2808_length_1689_cov_353_805179_g1769_i012981609
MLHISVKQWEWDNTEAEECTNLSAFEQRAWLARKVSKSSNSALAQTPKFCATLSICDNSSASAAQFDARPELRTLSVWRFWNCCSTAAPFVDSHHKHDGKRYR